MVAMSGPRWRGTFAFEVLGARVAVRSTRTEPAELLSYLPPGARLIQPSEADVVYSLDEEGDEAVLRVGESILLASRDPVLVRAKLEGDLHYRIALAARDRVIVHAGVVAIGGRAVVIPGRTFAGKSSLVAHLVEAGATYFSDELALFDGEGRVHPYPRPLRLRARRHDGLPARAIDLGPDQVGRESAPVGLILVSRFEPGASWSPRVLAPGEAVLALFDNTILARERPAESLAAFARAATAALAVAGSRGEAPAVGRWIHSVLAAGGAGDAGSA